jgi:hypothetical protein
LAAGMQGASAAAARNRVGQWICQAWAQTAPRRNRIVAPTRLSSPMLSEVQQIGQYRVPGLVGMLLGSLNLNRPYGPAAILARSLSSQRLDRAG